MSPFVQRPSMHPVAQPACQWRDTPQRYGRISRYLHWVMAVLLGWQFAGMVAKVTLGRESAVSQTLSGAHAHVGLLLLLLVAVRGGWALSQMARRPPQGAGPWGVAAWVGHGALYVLMVVVPLLAALRMLGNNRAFSWLGLIPLNDGTGEKIEWMVAPANAAHGWLGWLLLVLIVGHIAMVLVHRWVWKDGISQRMLGRVPED